METAKLYKFTAYSCDVNNDFDTFEEYIDYINEKMKYGGEIKHFDVQEVEVEWDDDIDLNQLDCPKEAYEKYFE